MSSQAASSPEYGTRESATTWRDPSRLLTMVIEKVHVKSILAAYAVLFAIYVYLPMFSVVAFSFNSGGLTFPFGHFTLQWYGKLLQNEGLINSVLTSLKLSFFTMLIVTVLSTAIGLAYRYDFRGKRALLYTLIAAIIIPGATYGIGAELFLIRTLGLPKGWLNAIPIEVVYTTSFGVIIILASLPQHLHKHEQAARVLGASRWTVYREIVIPQVWSTVLGAAVFSFTLTYNESMRSLLLLGTQTTVANKIYSIAVRQRPTPQLFALGTLSTLASMALLIFGVYLMFYRD